MRGLVLIAVLLALLGLGLKEALWRRDHGLADPDAASSSTRQLAQVRFLPAGSVLPYGRGVFLHPKWAVLLSLQSELAFAGHCSSIATRWTAEDRLRIHCELADGEPVLPRAEIAGTRIEVVVQRRRAVALAGH
jgi:hypothetical protein